MNAAQQNPNQDVIVANSPNDTVSALLFSPTANFLAASSWNKEVAVYEVGANGQAAPKAKVQHTHPVLCLDWSPDGAQVVSGGTDSLCKLWNLASNQEITIGQHAAPIKSVHFVKEMNVVITGSYDKTIKYWDMRTPTPVATVQLNERVYAMDVKHPVLAVATATVPENVIERGVNRVDKKNKIFVYDLSNPQQPFRVIESPLKFQHRCLSIFPDKTGIAVGSVEGRVAITHVQEKDIAKNFAFKLDKRQAQTESIGRAKLQHVLIAAVCMCVVSVCPQVPPSRQRHLRRELAGFPPLRHIRHGRQRRSLHILVSRTATAKKLELWPLRLALMLHLLSFCLCRGTGTRMRSSA